MGIYDLVDQPGALCGPDGVLPAWTPTIPETMTDNVELFRVAHLDIHLADTRRGCSRREGTRRRVTTFAEA